jgi:uncharacterized protein (DUF1501 family)
MPDRRDFLLRALAWSAAGLIVPSFLRRGSLLDPSVSWAGAAAEEGARSEAAPFAGRILVWINLSGGNDGLNTVIPYTDPEYYTARQTLAIPPAQVIPLSATMGLHPSLGGLSSIYNAGRMAVVQSVGYPGMSLSHFRGTDIWMSGSAENVNLETGWMARFLEAMFPAFPDWLPDSPYGIQQASGHRLPFAGDRGLTGLIVDDPSSFYYLIGATFPGAFDDALPATRGGEELSFLRALDAQTSLYAEAIQAASDAGSNTVDYPQTLLGSQLSIVARLMSGGLRTPAYQVSEFGFDTHAAQGGLHADLLASVGSSIDAFWRDLGNQGLRDRVLILTTSEFGRRVDENGNLGTDHGTAAPHLLIGNRVAGGVHGSDPDLEDLDQDGNLLVGQDYRNVYASVLRDHFGASQSVVNDVLQGTWPGVGGLLDPVAGAPGEEHDAPANLLFRPAPNPARAGAGDAVFFTFELATPAEVTLDLIDPAGRHVVRIAGEHHAAGRHEIAWNPERIPAGTYFVRFEAGTFTGRGRIVLLP